MLYIKQGRKRFSLASLRKSQKAGLQYSFSPVIAIGMGAPLKLGNRLDFTLGSAYSKIHLILSNFL
jgi:hypothetical protein